MKVIFLDFDGVLNSKRFLKSFVSVSKKGPSTEEMALLQRWNPRWLRAGLSPDRLVNLSRMLDRRAVDRLNLLVAATGASVVVSSDWRLMMQLPGLLTMLRYAGYDGEILDETISWQQMAKRLSLPTDRKFEPPRGKFIEAWLREHPEATDIVILDDRGDMEPFLWHLVQTDEEVGIQGHDLKYAISLFLKQAEF